MSDPNQADSLLTHIIETSRKSLIEKMEANRANGYSFPLRVMKNEFDKEVSDCLV